MSIRFYCDRCRVDGDAVGGVAVPRDWAKLVLNPFVGLLSDPHPKHLCPKCTEVVENVLRGGSQ